MDITQLVDFDRSLAPGTLVECRWTNCNRKFVANGTVLRPNTSTVVVTLSHDVATGFAGGGYKAGETIKVPRFPKATQNNGVYPRTKTDEKQVDDAEKVVAAVAKFHAKVSEVIKAGGGYKIEPSVPVNVMDLMGQK